MSCPQYYLQLEDAEGTYVQLWIECCEYPLDALVAAVKAIPATHVLSEKKYTMQESQGKLVFQQVGEPVLDSPEPER